MQLVQIYDLAQCPTAGGYLYLVLRVVHTLCSQRGMCNVWGAPEGNVMCGRATGSEAQTPIPSGYWTIGHWIKDLAQSPYKSSICKASGLNHISANTFQIHSV